MLYVLRKLKTHEILLRQVPEYARLMRKMSANGTTENVGSEQCKREHEENVEKTYKKLCKEEDYEEVKKKRKRRKYALLLAYNGSHYYGMQFNSNYRTVESELFKAFNKVGIMLDSEVNEPYSIRFQRAARTDKSVSAARQLVSFLMSDVGCKPEDINAHLPQDIRVFSLKLVTKRFDSKVNCISRKYSYMLPTHAFSPDPSPLNSFLQSDYRITPDIITKIKETLKIFVGTHNFHNYTSRMNALDPRAKRFIISFTCDEPFVRNKEFITLTVKGQSFILHQIRKMVGALILVVRGIITTEKLKTSFLLERMNVPLAPGDGLFLEKPYFNKYNERYGKDGIHETLTWEDVEEDILKFREEHIISRIIDKELEQQTMMSWIDALLRSENPYFKPFPRSDDGKPAENADGDEEEQDDDCEDELRDKQVNM